MMRILSILIMLFTLSFTTASVTLINPSNNSNVNPDINFQFKTTGDDLSYLSNISVIGFGYIGTDIPTINGTITSTSIINAPLGPAQWYVETWNDTSGDYILSDTYDFTVNTTTPSQYSVERTGLANSGSIASSANISSRQQSDSHPAYMLSSSPSLLVHVGFFDEMASIPPPPTPPTPTPSIVQSAGHRDTSTLDMSYIPYVALILGATFFIFRNKKTSDKQSSKP
jgi:hypothetical protein